MLAPIAGSRRAGKSSFRALTRYLPEGRDPVAAEIVERGEHLFFGQPAFPRNGGGRDAGRRI